MDREKLINEIMREAEKEGEPLTRKEAEEVADMEIKASGNRTYEKSDKKQKPAKRERKVDPEKRHILDCIRILLEGMQSNAGETVMTALKTETELYFNFHGNSYTLKLVKHRKEK